MGATEFIWFVAVSLAAGAFAIDAMLPALQAIASDFGLAHAKRAQAAVAAFLLGVGVSQLVFGPMSDRYGRKPLFLGGLALFIVAGCAAALAGNFPLLLGARLLQGIGAGAQRVVVFSIVRDRHAGVELARVLSLAMAVLLIEPLLAPMYGQAILLLGSWRGIAASIAIVGMVLFIWALCRLEETLPRALRRPVTVPAILAAYREVLAHRPAVAAMLTFGLMSGAHIGFLTSSQAIFQDIYQTGLHYTPLLALITLAMSVASFSNVAFMRRFGSAVLIEACLLAMALLNGAALAAACFGTISLPVFLLLQGGNMFAFGLLIPNLTALSMQPFGHIAGTASSLYGFMASAVGATLGFAIGQGFDGTLQTMFAAYIALSLASRWLLGRVRPAMPAASPQASPDA
jgi:DHA1 family bicyclomycin/chloramphenicol resistance-like MFS transporter